MAATFTLSGDLATIVGANIDPKAVQVYVEASEPAITDTTAHVTRLGSVQATVNSDGTWTAPGLIATNATDIVPAPVAGQSFKYRVLIRYRDARTSTVKNLATGWFDLTANLKFDAIDERQLTQVDAAFADDIIDQVQASVDAAVAAKTAAQTAATAAQAVGTTNDTVIAGRINTPGSATATALSNSIGQLKAWAKNPDNLVAGALTYASGLLVSAVAEWPDGAPGVLTITSRQSSTDAVTGYTITRVVGGVTTTYTQPTITRDSSGLPTTVPQITVA